MGQQADLSHRWTGSLASSVQVERVIQGKVWNFHFVLSLFTEFLSDFCKKTATNSLLTIVNYNPALYLTLTDNQFLLFGRLIEIFACCGVFSFNSENIWKREAEAMNAKSSFVNDISDVKMSHCQVWFRFRFQIWITEAIKSISYGVFLSEYGIQLLVLNYWLATNREFWFYSCVSLRHLFNLSALSKSSRRCESLRHRPADGMVP